MSKQIVSAVSVTAVIGGLMLALMYYGTSGPVDPNMQVTCRSGEGGQLVKIADQDCTFIAQTLADRLNSVAQYQYFIEGNDIALVEPQSRRVVAKIDVQQSKTP